MDDSETGLEVYRSLFRTSGVLLRDERQGPAASASAATMPGESDERCGAEFLASLPVRSRSCGAFRGIVVALGTPSLSPSSSPSCCCPFCASRSRSLASCSCSDSFCSPSPVAPGFIPHPSAPRALIVAATAAAAAVVATTTAAAAAAVAAAATAAAGAASAAAAATAAAPVRFFFRRSIFCDSPADGATARAAAGAAATASAMEVHSSTTTAPPASSEQSSHEAPLPPDTRAPTLTSVIATPEGDHEAADLMVPANPALPPGGKVPELFSHR